MTEPLEPDPTEPSEDQAQELLEAEGEQRATVERRSYDWPAAKRRYVEGIPSADGTTVHWPTANEVAEHFGYPQNRTREHAATEGWVEARRKWQQQTERTRQQARAAALSREATDLDNRALSSAKMGLQLCLARLTEIGQAAQSARAQSAGQAGARSAIDPKEQESLAKAVDLWHKIGLRAVGDPETHRVEITGANGAPIEIAAELGRDDPGRLTGVLAVLQQAGLGELFAQGPPRVVEGQLGDRA